MLSNQIKKFEEPTDGQAGIYVYRIDTHKGASLKKAVWIDNECIGETAKGTFFYSEVEGDVEHTISTESEFSPNDLILKPKSGQLYFIEQYIKLGLFVGGAGLNQTNTEQGKEEVTKLQLAKQGQCSQKSG